MNLPAREADTAAKPFLIPVGMFMDQQCQLRPLHGTLSCRLTAYLRLYLFQKFLGERWTENRRRASHGTRPLPGLVVVSLLGRELYHTMLWNPDIICEMDHLASGNSKCN